VFAGALDGVLPTTLQALNATFDSVRRVPQNAKRDDEAAGGHSVE
jgi:hypothetical protein